MNDFTTLSICPSYLAMRIITSCGFFATVKKKRAVTGPKETNRQPEEGHVGHRDSLEERRAHTR